MATGITVPDDRDGEYRFLLETILQHFKISGLEVMVLNAAPMKALPGRKTDASDAEWPADLPQHWLLNPKQEQYFQIRNAVD